MKQYLHTRFVHCAGKFVSLIIFIALFTSCYTQRNVNLLQENESLPVYERADYANYKISPNDEVLFRLISTDDEFTKMIDAEGSNAGSQQGVSYRVYPDNTVDLPYVDSVRIGGLTLEEATQAIKQKYKKIIPDVEVKLTLANKTYTVIGDAGNGIFPIYKEKLTIFQALAQSGAIQLEGDRKHVKIVRETLDSVHIMEFDIRPKSIINSKYYYVYPNDIIYVQRTSSSFYKVNNYSSFLGLITSSISLLLSVLYFNKVK